MLLVSFKGAHLPKDVILYAVFFYVRYGVSYRDLEEIMRERGVSVDHTTLNRWVARYYGAIASQARRRKQQCDRSWRMDETYIRPRYPRSKKTGEFRQPHRYSGPHDPAVLNGPYEIYKS